MHGCVSFLFLMVRLIRIEELTAISSSETFVVLELDCFEADAEKSSWHHRLSVSDSSPAHGESQDEVLRRRHGDKEVRICRLFITELFQ